MPSGYFAKYGRALNGAELVVRPAAQWRPRALLSGNYAICIRRRFAVSKLGRKCLPIVKQRMGWSSS